MKKGSTILIADRNQHVRGFLRRELMAEGYEICVADKGRDVLRRIYSRQPLDLLVVDPDLADMGWDRLLRELQDRIPVLPVIVHAFASDYEPNPNEPPGVIFVEKGETTIEKLKQVVHTILIPSVTQLETDTQQS